MTDIGDYDHLTRNARTRDSREQVCAGCLRDLTECNCHSNTSANTSGRQAK